MSFLMELKALVESGAVEHDWDLAVYSVLRRERECIIPEVSNKGCVECHNNDFIYWTKEQT